MTVESRPAHFVLTAGQVQRTANARFGLRRLVAAFGLEITRVVARKTGSRQLLYNFHRTPITQKRESPERTGNHTDEEKGIHKHSSSRRHHVDGAISAKNIGTEIVVADAEVSRIGLEDRDTRE